MGGWGLGVHSISSDITAVETQAVVSFEGGSLGCQGQRRLTGLLPF